MIIGVDATSINDGGGITHLSQIINSYKHNNSQCKKIFIWGNKNTLSKVKNKKKIKKIILNRKYENILFRIFWQLFLFEKELKKYNCEKALILGGISFLKTISPTIIMQNILPFELSILKKYPFSFRVKCKIQRILFIYSLKTAGNVIFLSQSSKKQITKNISNKKIISKIIPHGINKEKFSKRNFYFKKKIKLLCVSKIDYYKNQIIIIKALKILLKEGYNLELNLVGGFYGPALKELNKTILKCNVKKNVVIKKEVVFKNIKKEYRNSNIHIASSLCESFGITVLESGNYCLPTICSNIKIFNEITGQNVFMFNANSEINLARLIKKVINNNYLRQTKIKRYYNFINKNYSWEKVANETFNFVLNDN